MNRLKEKDNRKQKVTEASIYQAIFDSSLAGLFVLDAEGNILKVNAKSERMFGYKKGALLNKNIEIIFPKRFKKEIEFFIKNPPSDPIQILGLDKNGVEFAIDFRMVRTVVEDQTISAVYCKNADLAVFESDRKLRTLVANAPGIVYRCKTDKLWTMEFLSNACESISGYVPEQFYERGNLSWGTLIHTNDRGEVNNERRKAISKKESYQICYRITTATNKLKWILEIGSCVENQLGKVDFLEGFMQDVTNQKEAEISLTKEKELLYKYLETAASIFLVINIDHKITMVNRKACEVLGYEAKEMVGKNWFNHYIPKSQRKDLAQFFDLMTKGKLEPPDFKENWVIAKGNIRKLIRWRNALLKDENGMVTGLISSGIDVTEQVNAERELRASVNKNKAIIEALPDVLTVHDKKGTVLEIHVPDESYLVAPIAEIEGKNIKDLLPKELGDQLKNITQTVLRNQKMETLEVTAPVANGTVDYECRFVPFNKNQVLTIARNISKTKEIQKMLHLRNKALDAAGNGIIIVDAQQPDMPIIYCNNAFTEITGYNREEVLGVNCKFLQNDDRDQEAIVTMVKAIQKGEASRVFLRNYRKDGSLFWNDLSITPLFNENQILTHFIGVQNDVTEIHNAKNQLEQYANKLEEKVANRTKEIEATVQKLVENNLILEDQIQETKLAESEAQRSQAQFNAIAENFPNGFIVVFNADCELVYLEGEELKRMNLNKADFEGKHIDEISIFSKRQIEQVKQDLIKTIAGNSISFEVEFGDFCYAVNTTPLKSEENIVWALFVYNNITEQKNVQEKLAKALKEEQELNELKSRFISMASHEFRTPLSAILSSAILIGKQNEPGMEERREKHVSRIRNHVKHLVVILNDFLSLSKLEEGKVDAKPQYFDLIEYCKIVIDEMESTKKKGQVIKFNHTSAEIPVFLDPKLLSHILINLLSNALKYSEEGNDVVMEIQQADEAVLFKIIDNGIGIPEKDQKNLFDRFFRAENATNISGTGLGLHIVKHYAELMRGTVKFKSKTGNGSTFTVQLPQKLYEHEKNIIN
ncbi:PAS domain S-box-containing protein [Maribacter orientalis]|uniref:histidine kinase n=1 Tax=Maribacter orientalis TaxID=228957 RepID=A0A1H7NUK5_9FLAO|nr:PAS domain S-box protein [Maribacter orientalis]SEL27131.1 PAS domain S-box-containing protein [Maribacter orientalis]